MKMDYTLEIVDRMSLEEMKGVLKVNKENLYVNGGTLHYDGILRHDYAVLAKSGERVIAYTLLCESFITKKDMYVMQVAVANDYKNAGIGSQMYKYIYNHLKGYKLFTANVNPKNTASKAFHAKNNFELTGRNGLGLLYIRKVRRDAKLRPSAAKKETFTCTVKDSQADLGPSL